MGKCSTVIAHKFKNRIQKFPNYLSHFFVSPIRLQCLHSILTSLDTRTSFNIVMIISQKL